jgi:hypothetical protein
MIRTRAVSLYTIATELLGDGAPCWLIDAQVEAGSPAVCAISRRI